jgi:[acyl-carrier-protein] S-malonyltransferase
MSINMSKKLAFVFPGQGSQSMGMLSDMAAKYPIIQQTFAEASSALGYDLFQLIQEGPLEKLNQTEYTQPALLTASVALWRHWLMVKEARPTLLAGHSLGEYSALVCAQSLALTDAVNLVALRGRLMQEAVPEGEGAMAALLGLSDEIVNEVCLEAKQNEVVAPANYNTIGQVVISGHTAAVLRAMELAKTRGAKRALRLPVSVPSHCELMKPAALLLAPALNNIDFKLPNLPVIHNVDVIEHNEIENIRQALVNQLYQPVRWVETVQKMEGKGITTVLECGPAAVLSGLNKRIVSTLECHSLSNGEAYADE